MKTTLSYRKGMNFLFGRLTILVAIRRTFTCPPVDQQEYTNDG
ncbi:hypothetical protein [Acinetobacter baumannii]|nr:hypothetical protein [Acinetobacter baumannii]